MSDQLIITPNLAFAGGVYAPGAKATFYRTGTTTPYTVYTDTGLGTAHPSPLVADSNGVFAQVFTDGQYDAKVVITESDDTAIVTIDPVPTAASTGSGASDISITPTANNAGTDVETFVHNIQADIDNIGAAADKGVTGTDANAVTGTAGTAGNLVKWNINGDARDAGVATSTDGTLASNSDAKVPTEKAVKTYVDGKAGWRFIVSYDASALATADFTQLDASLYDAYCIVFANVIPTTDDVDLWLRTSTDGGSTYDASTSYYYVREGRAVNTSSTTSGDVGGAYQAAQIVLGNRLGSAASEDGFSGAVYIYGPHLARRTRVTWDGGFLQQDGDFVWVSGAGERMAQEDVDAVQILFSASSTIASGTMTLYGLRNS